MKITNTVETAIMTGASSGIDPETAKQLAGHGYKVYAIAGRLNRLNTLIEKYQQIMPRKIDHAESDPLEDFCREITSESSSVAVLVNNAGYFLRGVIENVL